MTWLLINIAKFIFMTTNEKVTEIPTSVRDADQCTEYFLAIKPQLYQRFVEFWTQHRRFTRKCNQHLCSKVFVVDGHQKANRLVCQYKNVFDCTIPELGPVQMGCLYSPLRKGSFTTCKVGAGRFPMLSYLSCTVSFGIILFLQLRALITSFVNIISRQSQQQAVVTRQRRITGLRRIKSKRWTG